MATTIDTYVEERLRLALTGSISGQTMDSFIPNLTTLFKTVRPSTPPSSIFIAISEPSICSEQYCCCKEASCRLNKYKLTIFISRREQGRPVTKPWIRAISTQSFEDAVRSLMEQADKLVKETEVGGQDKKEGKVDSETCSVEVLDIESSVASQEV